MEAGLFDCFTKVGQEHIYHQEAVKMVNYFVTDYPRITPRDKRPFSGFAYTFFENQSTAAFTTAQPKTMALASGFFSDTKSLGKFEQEVLHETFMQSLKSAPTRKNRL